VGRTFAWLGRKISNSTAKYEHSHSEQIMCSLRGSILVYYLVIKQQHYIRAALEGEKLCLHDDPFSTESL